MSQYMFQHSQVCHNSIKYIYFRNNMVQDNDKGTPKKSVPALKSFIGM